MAGDETEVLPAPASGVVEASQDRVRPGLSRRSFIGKAAGVVAGLMTRGILPGNIAAREIAPEPEQLAPDKKADSDKKIQIPPELEDAKSLLDEISRYDQTNVEQVWDLEKRFLALCRVYPQKLAEAKQVAAGKAKLTRLYQQLLGPITSVVPESKLSAITYYSYSGQLEDIRLYPTILQRLFSAKLQELKHELPPDALVPAYETMIDYLNKMSSLGTEEKANKELPVKYCSLNVPIQVDEGITPSEAGLALFEIHKERIGKLIQTYRYFKNTCKKIVLYSTKYGQVKKSAPEGYSGMFFVGGKDNDAFGRIWINMDHAALEDEWPEITFAHEAFGHHLSVLTNASLAQVLTPRQFMERLIFEQEILNNPDWGDSDGSIGQLFRARPHIGRSDQFIVDAPSVDREEFMAIITEYPRNLILTNGSFIDAAGSPNIYEKVAGQDASPRPFALGEDKKYRSLKEFYTVYRPILESQSQIGNIQAKLILWGLDNFPNEFANTSFLWGSADNQPGTQFVPRGNNLNGRIWSNYCNFVVVNAVMYHLAFNSDQENTRSLRQYFPRPVWERVEQQALSLRERARNEMFADGVAYSHFFGNRMKETPPYRRGLEHMAWLLIQK